MKDCCWRISKQRCLNLQNLWWFMSANTKSNCCGLLYDYTWHRPMFLFICKVFSVTTWNNIFYNRYTIIIQLCCNIINSHPMIVETIIVVRFDPFWGVIPCTFRKHQSVIKWCNRGKNDFILQKETTSLHGSQNYGVHRVVA